MELIGLKMLEIHQYTFMILRTICSSEMLFFAVTFKHVSKQHVLSMGMIWKPVSATGLRLQTFYLTIMSLYLTILTFFLPTVRYKSRIVGYKLAI